jgi:hypothetical protein
MGDASSGEKETIEASACLDESIHGSERIIITLKHESWRKKG